ncbi:YycC family protein [Paenibacillus sp. NPDC058174]|uniref:YycC family protein n=1 Tax=Paenibacillus sp. NPDC058174 TaxID=3346366 RepID=UPI0036DCDC21
MSKPLQISPDTAIKLSKQLGVPIEHLMHMPRHILLQKLAELAKAEAGSAAGQSDKTEDSSL